MRNSIGSLVGAMQVSTAGALTNARSVYEMSPTRTGAGVYVHTVLGNLGNIAIEDCLVTVGLVNAAANSNFSFTLSIVAGQLTITLLTFAVAVATDTAHHIMVNRITSL